ncbi:uncharacterized protein LOC9649132 [Selaginella moellendorffii]|uniref:uncharacterized protein LOC9649132 n=1 Tax=Selaginella moellendorffii TaxID=88036 RepID=UPI000D1C4934|nr:uncharacterized protein LOC9649132 [Selaginella moellendorffii]|eukprot:XP_024537461.1 uncharacterized protein LOC9649132 [Selaginella moellendorffii]
MTTFAAALGAAIFFQAATAVTGGYESALGDPGMRSPNSRVLLEGWNFCNGAENIGSGQPSPRWADCTDKVCKPDSVCSPYSFVSNNDNQLRTGDIFPNRAFKSYQNPDLYAVEKEKFLASLCQVSDFSNHHPWYFWNSMLKNGNFDMSSGLCPATSKASSLQVHTQLTRPFKKIVNAFPCFGDGCMNQPVVVHEQSTIQRNCSSHGCVDDLKGRFYGTYDLNRSPENVTAGMSFFSVAWEKNISSGSWIFKHRLQVSKNYPWLMLYLRADATSGLSGGYPWDTRGIMTRVPESPNFKVVVTLNVTKGGGPQSLFYLLDIGGCWKNNGQPCDGDVKTDVTRYSEMIINPETTNWCTPSRLDLCPPYHVTSTGTIVYRNDTVNFPYSAYHLYCSPTNAEFPEHPFSVCDPYSNPQPQELVQILPHPEWAVNGYPSRKGEGWIGDARTWTLDAGALSSRLYFYQDPGSFPARRVWPSIDIGTEIYISSSEELAEWTVTDFDVLVPVRL